MPQIEENIFVGGKSSKELDKEYTEFQKKIAKNYKMIYDKELNRRTNIDDDQYSVWEALKEVLR